MGKQIKNTEESIKLLKVITETKENLIAIIREIVGERKVEINLSIRQPFEDTMYGSVEKLYVSELYFNEDEDCIIVLDDEDEKEEHFLLDEGLDFIKSVCQKVVLDVDKTNMEKKEYTYEVCPYCGEEVKLDAELKVQVCPNCGKHIVDCSMCLANSDGVEKCCLSCPLVYLADEMNKEVGIMDITNGHDKHLVELLNKCWDKHALDVRGFIMKALYLRDYEECIDKEVFTEKDWDGWESLDWNWEKYAYDYLMKVADDTDLKTILYFLRENTDIEK